MKEKLTISDIAELAGVAKSTVSRYLNGEVLRKKQQIVSKRLFQNMVTSQICLLD